jgi:hypothetical protein
MTDEERRLLELTENAEGCTDALLTERGFKLDVLISIVGGAAGSELLKPASNDVLHN